MNYQETLDYLYSQLPMFHRVGALAYKPDLNNTIALMKLLHDPQHKFKSIHIAGTNGKGSTSHMLASILQCAGYKTGLYTSPHLKDFRERIRINGAMIPESKVIAFVSEHKSAFEKIKLSFFEMTLGLCFDYFSEENIDIAIVETGLGGRLDATNIITPILSVITNIGYDHITLLGDTLPKIAFEKAGIIKPNTPVVIGETNADTQPTFTEKAHLENAPITFADQSLNIVEYSIGAHLSLTIAKGNTILFKDLKLDLTGIYQLKNILAVIESLLQLRSLGLNIPDEAIRGGLSNVQRNTGLMGRWQTIARNPLTIVDTGHNVDGIKQVLNQLAYTPHKHLHIIFGVVSDKDVSGVLELLPNTATYYFCKADIPRALDENELANMASEFGLKGNTYVNVKDAYISAKYTAKNDDLVLITGSTFVVAEVL